MTRNVLLILGSVAEQENSHLPFREWVGRRRLSGRGLDPFPSIDSSGTIERPGSVCGEAFSQKLSAVSLRLEADLRCSQCHVGWVSMRQCHSNHVQSCFFVLSHPNYFKMGLL